MTFEATYLGSNGWLIKFKKTNLIIDPWLKGDLIFPPGEWFFKGSLEEEISIDKKIDIILLTQGLPDHCHVPTLEIYVSKKGKDPDQRDYVVSNQKIESLGWSPTCTLDDGIAELVKGYKIVKPNIYANA